MIDDRNFFYQPVKNEIRRHDVRKIVRGQEDDYKTGYLLAYGYFKDTTNWLQQI